MAKTKNKIATVKSDVVDTTDLDGIVESIHSEFGRLINHYQRSILNCIAIGEYLYQAKGIVPKPEWSSWVDANLPFRSRQAYKYLAAYEQRDFIRVEITKGHHITLNTLSEVLVLDTPEEAVDGEVLQKENKEYQRRLESLKKERDNLRKKIEKQGEQLQKLGSSAVDEKQLKPEIVKLKNQRDDILAEVRGLESAYKVVTRFRETFANELAVLAELNVTDNAKEYMGGDVKALLKMVAKWQKAMKEAFGV